MNSLTERWLQIKSELPLIAILRGVEVNEVLGVADVLQRAGFLCLEVPLNSPNAFDSIEVLAREFGDEKRF